MMPIASKPCIQYAC